MHRFVEHEGKDGSPGPPPRAHREMYGEFRCKKEGCNFVETLPFCPVHQEIYESRLAFLQAHSFFDFGEEEGMNLDCV